MKTSCLIRLCLTAAMFSFATEFSANALTPAAPPQSYLDQGWTQLFEARGDLNRDGIDDRVIVVEAPDSVTKPSAGCEDGDDYSDAPVRRLLVMFADGNGGETLAADEPQVVLRRDQGGVFGDPLEDLSIERGAIVIHHYGGSRWRWGNTLRFRFGSDQWRLIGMTDMSYDSARGNNVEYDYNPLTGKMVRTVEIVEESADEPVCVACRVGETCPEKNGCFDGTHHAKPGSERFNIGRKPPVRMSGFLCWQERTGLLKYLGFEDGR